MNAYKNAQDTINQMVGIKPTKTQNTFKTNIMKITKQNVSDKVTQFNITYKGG